jgi:hypothetical protein
MLAALRPRYIRLTKLKSSPPPNFREGQCARKYIAMLNDQTHLPITSLAYFTSLIEEVTQQQIPAGYWDHVRRKMEEMEKLWLQTRSTALATHAVPDATSTP